MTPAAASAAIRSRMASRLVRPAFGLTTSATPIACVRRVPSGPVSATRAVEPTPNQSCAGLSSVNQCSAVSTSGWPNGRPMTAVAVSYTGRPPGTSGGKADPQQPVLPNVAVHVGTELHPLLAVPEQGLLGDRQSAQAEFGDQARADGAALGPDPRGPSAEPRPGPFGDRCQGPSPQRGWAGYSSARAISLPGPAARSSRCAGR